MTKPQKLVFVGASWANFNEKLRRICQDIAQQKGLGFEEREEDFVFLMKYGERDEFGGADTPQVFVVYDDGRVKHVLTKVPVAGMQPDFETARKRIEEALEE